MKPTYFKLAIIAAIILSSGHLISQAFTPYLHNSYPNVGHYNFSISDPDQTKILCKYTFEEDSGIQNFKIPQITEDTPYFIDIIQVSGRVLKFLIKQKTEKTKRDNNIIYSSKKVGQGSLEIRKLTNSKEPQKWVGILEYYYSDSGNRNFTNIQTQKQFSRIGFVSY